MIRISTDEINKSSEIEAIGLVALHAAEQLRRGIIDAATALSRLRTSALNWKLRVEYERVHKNGGGE